MSRTSTTPYVSPAVDVPALAELLDGPHADARRLVRENLVEHADILGDAQTMERDEFRQRVLDVLLVMAGTGQTGMGFPKEYGGGGDVAASIAAFETLAYGDLSVLVKAGVQYGLFGGAILHLGTREHHESYLQETITGKLLGCFAMTETGHGSNVQALETTATYDADTDEFVVHTPTESARKDYIGNAASHARLAVVFAQLVVGGEARGVHALVVPIRDPDGRVMPGVRIEDCGRKIGLNGVDNGRIWFHDVRVPRSSLLNRYAVVRDDGTYFSEIENPDRRFFTMLGTLVQGRVSVGGAAISASKVALALAVKYGLVRRQFGAPGTAREQLLLDYGMHQRRLFPLLARTYALHFAQDVVRGHLHDVLSDDAASEHDRRALESRAAGTKVVATWHATRTIQECREACGGAGYLSANRFDALRADTDVFTTFEGDNHVLLQLVAKGLLTDYAGEFENLDQIGMMRFVAGAAVETVIERTSVHKLLDMVRDMLPAGDADTDPGAGILDSSYHLNLLRWREEHMLASAARRLKRGMAGGGDPVAVFSNVQDHVIGAAWAHVERLMLDAFVDRVDTMPDGGNKQAMQLVCDLFALSVIEQDRAWFMEHGRLSNAKSKAVTAMVNELCRRVRPIAGQLVDAFDIPPEMLRAEIIPAG